MAGPKVVFYTKPDCHLCEDALALLLSTGRSLGMEVQVSKVDITTDPALEETYGGIIPVLVFGGGATLTAPIEPGPLRAALQAALR